MFHNVRQAERIGSGVMGFGFYPVTPMLPTQATEFTSPRIANLRSVLKEELSDETIIQYAFSLTDSEWDLLSVALTGEINNTARINAILQESETDHMTKHENQVSKLREIAKFFQRRSQFKHHKWRRSHNIQGKPSPPKK
jgi:hypothetical protein